ncbi:hypothetical protein JCGZ_10100 [Jatropha curcas]|uniref:AB hydrolase-1 domain-containing protein n=1 Tax=Jatropha curcas TaxID=180498 RepID=A0A067LN71_JATCU|nr:epoxide hydrolase 4 [Jatropha curcas]KDP46260.1 hypothetical protein JCGZ_10100 [Jatropha curcas]
MVNTLVTIYLPILHVLVKLVGMRPHEVEIEPGTVIHFWVPRTHKPNKPALVFLHGFGLNGLVTWQFQVLSLARNYAVYVPDFLFFGSSITNKPDRSPEFQAECMAKGLRKIGVEKCSLVGLSYGGMIGFKMAEMYPDLVRSMVVSSSVMALTESISGDSLDRIGFSSWILYLLPRTVNGFKQMLNIATYKLPWLPNFAYKHFFEVMFNHRKERTELLEALITRDKEFRIPSYSQNIHLLWGENDKIFNLEDAYNLKEQLKGKATLHYIEKAGHLVPLERPFAYNRQLNKILALQLQV